MKPLAAAFFLPLVLLATRVCAQGAGDDPKGGTLVDCGGEKIAIFAHSESAESQYAVGWTVRPDRNKKPVDWSSYDPTNLSAWLDKYPMDDELASGEYALVDGIVDLRAGKFTPLPTHAPFWPQKNHADFGVRWSGNEHGTRYAIINNDARWSTTNLWLVAATLDGVRFTDLAPAANKAVTALVKKHSRASANYATVFATTPAVAEGKTPPPNPFKGKSLKVAFEAEIPKSDDPGFTGELTISIPQGTILRISGGVAR